MNRGDTSSGFTIVETLIFLAVSAALFASAMLLIGGKQNKAVFVTAVRDFESQLTDISNNLSTGFYSTGGNYRCSTGATGPVISSSLTDTRGTNGDCILVGSVLKFGVGSSTVNREQYLITPMAGLRLTPAGDDVTTLAGSKPKSFSTSTTPNFSVVQLDNGVSIECVAIGNSCSPASTEYGALGFFNSFRTNSEGKSELGGIQTDLFVYKDINPASTNIDAINKLSNGTAANQTDYGALTSFLNPTNGVTICLKSGTTNQYALVRIGSNNSSKLAISNEIKEGSTCS